MPAATALALGVAGLGMSAWQMIEGAKEKNSAIAELNKFPANPLQNYYKGLHVSTLGANLQANQRAGLSASEVNALQGAGVRGVVGGLGRVDAESQDVNSAIAANLDKEQTDLNTQIAGADTNNQMIMEERRKAKLAALSSQLVVGKQQMWSGAQGMLQSGVAGVAGYAQLGGFGDLPTDAWNSPTAKTTTGKFTAPNVTWAANNGGVIS